MDRRQFLGGLAAAGSASLAGCGGAIGSVAPPQLPTDRLDEGGWEQTGSNQGTAFRNQYGPVAVVGKQHTLTFEDVALRESVREKTLGQVDSPLAIVSATHVDFSPDLNNLPAGIGRKEILESTEQSAREQFVTRMREAGLENVERSGTGTTEIDTGETASTTNYRATFPVESFTFDVTQDEQVSVPGADLQVNGVLAVWNHGDYVLVAGGAYPAESYEKHVTDDLSSAITVRVDVDLGLTPDRYRSEVRAILSGVT